MSNREQSFSQVEAHFLQTTTILFRIYPFMPLLSALEISITLITLTFMNTSLNESESTNWLWISSTGQASLCDQILGQYHNRPMFLFCLFFIWQIRYWTRGMPPWWKNWLMIPQSLRLHRSLCLMSMKSPLWLTSMMSLVKTNPLPFNLLRWPG